ncbi:MAG: hypothetical protein U0Q16_22735 [Bryobacteraceae bacterium]
MIAASTITPVTVGGMTVRIHCDSEEFAAMARQRYAGFVADTAADPAAEIEVELIERTGLDPDQDLEVALDGAEWNLVRGDFIARWNPSTRRATVRQNLNPYSLDSVLRVIHSLEVVAAGGFLLHSASAVRNGRAWLFSGKSGAGKTTISRLAPPDASLLTDEISYARPDSSGVWIAYGTPFYGELARPGDNISAPLAMACFLEKGPENHLDPLSVTEATGRILANVLFFAKDPALAARVLDNACAFAANVPASRLTFRPDPSVWELIR